MHGQLGLHWIKGVCVFRCSVILPNCPLQWPLQWPAICNFGRMTRIFYMPLWQHGVKKTPNKSKQKNNPINNTHQHNPVTSVSTSTTTQPCQQHTDTALSTTHWHSPVNNTPTKPCQQHMYGTMSVKYTNTTLSVQVLQHSHVNNTLTQPCQRHTNKTLSTTHTCTEPCQ